MKKRIFIAHMISPTLQEAIQRWRMKYLDLPVTWVENKNLHVTIVPPWYEEDISQVVAALQSIPSVSIYFTLLFNSIVFGPKHVPRLLWLQGIDSKDLYSLKLFLEQLLKQKPEKRVFHTHLTLARFQQSSMKILKESNIEQSVELFEEITSFSLVESHVRSTGASYETIIEIPLKK